MAWATEQVRLLFGAFRRAETDDPAAFMAACLRLFTAFPPDAVRHVVDPLTGLPSRSEWLPSHKAVRDALRRFHAASMMSQIQASRSVNRSSAKPSCPNRPRSIATNPRSLID